MGLSISKIKEFLTFQEMELSSFKIKKCLISLEMELSNLIFSDISGRKFPSSKKNKKVKKNPQKTKNKPL